MLFSFPYSINNSEETLVLSGYFVCANKAKEQPGPEQSEVALSSTAFTKKSLEKLGRKGAGVG